MVGNRVNARGALAHKDARADEHRFGTKLHYEGRIGWRGNAPGGEVRDRQLPCSCDQFDQFIRRLMLFGFGVKFFFTEHGENLHLLHNLAHVLDGVHHVSGASLTLGANHRRTLGDAPKRLAQIPRAANKRYLEGVLVHMVRFIRRRQHFTLVHEIDAEFLQDLRLGEVADAAFRHNGD